MFKLRNLIFLILFLIPIEANAASRFWVGGSGTWDASDTTHWAATSGGAGGQSVPTSSDTCTFDGNSGASATITVNANVTCSALALGTTGGNATITLDFATNNNSPTFGTFSFSGTGTRTLNCGSGTFTLNGASAGLGFDVATATNATISCTGVTLSFTGATTVGRVLSIGTAATIGTVNIGANSSGGDFQIAAGASSTLTITNLTISAPNRVVFQGSSSRVYTITNSTTLTGSSGSYISLYTGTQLSTLPTVNGSFTGTFVATGGIAWGTGTQAFTNCWNLGANTGAGFSCTAPATGTAHIIGG